MLLIFLLCSNAVVRDSSADNTAHKDADIAAAKSVVSNLQLALLQSMQQGKTMDFATRYQVLQPIILQSHNLAKIIRYAAGKYWKLMDDEQKQKLTAAFSRLSVSTYTFNFKEFNGEKFTYIAADKISRGIVVRTAIERTDKAAVKLDYILQKSNKWQIVNISAAGVSDLALKRSEYTGILKRDGFVALLDKINQKNNNYSSNRTN